MKTTPKPQARGPPIFKNFSLGAHMARVDSPVNTLIKLINPLPDNKF